MATMNRNVNLEEINSDAFLGIPFLNNQTVGQKIVFWGGVVAAVATLVVSTFAFDVNSFVSMLLMFIPILIGVIFGCNYNQDLTLVKYLYMRLFNQKTQLISKPKEDLIFSGEEIILHNKNKSVEEMDALQVQEMQKKNVKKLIIMISIVLVVIITLFAVIAANKNEPELDHHVVNVTQSY